MLERNMLERDTLERSLQSGHTQERTYTRAEDILERSTLERNTFERISSRAKHNKYSKKL